MQNYHYLERFRNPLRFCFPAIVSLAQINSKILTDLDGSYMTPWSCEVGTTVLIFRVEEIGSEKAVMWLSHSQPPDILKCVWNLRDSLSNQKWEEGVGLEARTLDSWSRVLPLDLHSLGITQKGFWRNAELYSRKRTYRTRTSRRVCGTQPTPGRTTRDLFPGIHPEPWLTSGSK